MNIVKHLLAALLLDAAAVLAFGSHDEAAPSTAAALCAAPAASLLQAPLESAPSSTQLHMEPVHEN
jgi:hypothetical protein